MRKRQKDKKQTRTRKTINEGKYRELNLTKARAKTDPTTHTHTNTRHIILHKTTRLETHRLHTSPLSILRCVSSSVDVHTPLASASDRRRRRHRHRQMTALALRLPSLLLRHWRKRRPFHIQNKKTDKKRLGMHEFNQAGPKQCTVRKRVRMRWHHHRQHQHRRPQLHPPPPPYILQRRVTGIQRTSRLHLHRQQKERRETREQVKDQENARYTATKQIHRSSNNAQRGG